jgi:hypothetical protein
VDPPELGAVVESTPELPPVPATPLAAPPEPPRVPAGLLLCEAQLTNQIGNKEGSNNGSKNEGTLGARPPVRRPDLFVII